MLHGVKEKLSAINYVEEGITTGKKGGWECYKVVSLFVTYLLSQCCGNDIVGNIIVNKASTLNSPKHIAIDMICHSEQTN